MSININYIGNVKWKEIIGLNIKNLEPILNLEEAPFEWEINFCALEEKERLHNIYMQAEFKGNDSYRALTHTKYKKTFIFMNTHETIESILWIFLHELTHINILHNSYINKVCKTNFNKVLCQNNISTIQDYEAKLGDDNFHELFIEEQIANNLATEIVGFNYNRIWWRSQFKKESN